MCELLRSADISCFVFHPLLTSIYAEGTGNQDFSKDSEYCISISAKGQDSVSVQFNGDGILLVAVQRYAMWVATGQIDFQKWPYSLCH
jgi:hypothetical protein